MLRKPTKLQTYENQATIFSNHVQINLIYMNRIPTSGERTHAINKAFQYFHAAIDSGDEADLYAACVHLAAVAGKKAMHDGCERKATKRALLQKKEN